MKKDVLLPSALTIAFSEMHASWCFRLPNIKEIATNSAIPNPSHLQLQEDACYKEESSKSSTGCKAECLTKAPLI